MGAVYEAEQRMGSAIRKVAVKVLLAELSRDATLRRRFHTECATIARLEHPHTVDVYDFGETDTGQLYVVMEFVRGPSLASIPLPVAVDRAVRVVGQVCGALHEAHLLGVVHRDLKPENILLTRRAGDDDFVKLLDFGIALQTGAGQTTRLTATGTILGTPPYMSPEQLEGRALDPRTDVYSLGVITYELLTGRLPFAASNPWEWAQRHRFDAPTSFDATVGGRDVPESVRAVVLSALAKRPELRPASAREYAARLESALASSRLHRRSRDGSAPAHPDAPSDSRVRTEAALVAPVAVAPPRRVGWPWIGLALVVPLAMLCLLVVALAAGQARVAQEMRADADVAAVAPPLAVLHADAVPPPAAPSASAVASAVAPAPGVSSAAAATPHATTTTRSPRRTSGATNLRRPPRPIR